MTRRIMVPPNNLVPANTELQRAQNKLMEEIAKRRGKILDDFGKAYLAETDLNPSEVILVQKTETLCVKFFFERRQGLYPVESKLMDAAKNLLQIRTEFMKAAKSNSPTTPMRELEINYTNAFAQLSNVINEVEEEHVKQREAVLPKEQI